ncbi:ATP-binding cassette domain-containing protein [Bifidobacterium sp. SMB2]|uniref:ATP-binding cassette domain-containing protein n=1 Tax=Bifidobacterium saimiriisciurei TaxID=2661627 RepID=A0ABX0CEU3_9BIFI|nr:MULTISPECIES: ATP-binding cassette domain-containing protein [Bifidobacterium]NEG95392.1 ATP-binding cassette domain-containing protein [Bifidobacterium sp. SMB2]NEH11424.1 ATP-binding cassette domain-containing protein [Bifidobacterium saimiriisciurei]
MSDDKTIDDKIIDDKADSKSIDDKKAVEADDAVAAADAAGESADAATTFPKFDIVYDDAVETVTLTGAPDANVPDVDASDADDKAAGDDADVESIAAESAAAGVAKAAEKAATTGGTETTDTADTDDIAAERDGDGSDEAEAVEAEHAASHIDNELGTGGDFAFRSYPVLALKHASYAPDSKGGDVIHDANMEFHARRLYAIWAQSDAEHVAIGGLLSGLMAPTSGKVMFKSQELNELTPAEYRGHFMGLIPQRYALRPDLSAVQNLVLTMEASGRNFLKAKPILAAEMLETVGFPEEKNDKPVRDLLEVERRKAAIARALICEANVIIIDEPTGQLGEQAGHEIMKLLRRLPKRDDHCVIIVTGDKALAESADHMFAL